MKRIGIVSCNKWKDKLTEDLLLQKFLTEDGITSDIISWEDKELDYTKYDSLILRSVWGYQDQYEQFKEWLLYVKSIGIPLFNDVDMVLNNIRKNVQFKILEQNQIPCVPTIFIDSPTALENFDLPSNKCVIKPIISGSGNNTYIFDNTDSTELDKTTINERLKETFRPFVNTKDNGIMIQPFMNGIEQGEYACIYIDGVNTHNMLRFPGIFTQKQKPIYLDTIPSEIKELADKVSQIEEYKNYLYMRVDIVKNNDQILIMEVELAEPDLLTKYIIDSNIRDRNIKHLAKSLERRG